MQELALQERFVVSLVPISKETPLFDPGKLYAAAIRNAVVPNRNDDVMTAVVSQAIGRRESWDDLEHWRSEEHTSELQSLMRISYAVFGLKKKKQQTKNK